MKRNDIISYPKNDPVFSPLGRINRVIGNGIVEVITCMKEFEQVHASKLELHNEYKGYTDHKGRFIRMTSLRKLKQRAAYYNKEVWKKNRKNLNLL